MKIIVNNKRSVCKYLGFDVGECEDLLKNEKCKNFIEQNLQYFTSTDPEDFIKFYKKTGIVLEKVYKKGNIKINIYGTDINYPYPIYSAHLCVIEENDEITIKDRQLYLNGNKIRNIKDEINLNKERFSNFYDFNNELKKFSNEFFSDFENEKEQLIMKKFNNLDLNLFKEAKQVIVTPFYDVFFLTDDGKVYFNSKLYSENVNCIFEENTVNKMLVYNDNFVEHLTSNYQGITRKYDDVLCNNYCLAMLKDRKLELIIKEDEKYIKNKSKNITLNGIDDFYLDDDEVILMAGNNKINLMLY